ncbi:MAG: hypothetical protein AAF492_28165, partial [Verrucomicrobiota bacterium]
FEWIEGEVVFDTDFKQYAHWDAITSIVNRAGGPAAIPTSLANQFAASYRAVTNANGIHELQGIPYRGTFRPRPMQNSILNPVETPREVRGFWDIGPFAVLGMFPGTDCEEALRETTKFYDSTPNYGGEDWWYGRGPGYCVGEASLRRFSFHEIVQIQNGSGTNLWDARGAMMYLFFNLIQDRIPASNQLEVLEHNAQNHLHSHFQGGNMQERWGLFYDVYQKEMSYRRGVEERRGTHFFSIK